jgi:hypothetical protein
MANINLAHIFVLGPLLIVIGSRRIELLTGKVVAALGAFIAVFHAYRAVKRWPEAVPWVNLFHLAVVGPALIALGLLADPPEYVGGTVIALGFAAIGYHLYRILA